MGELIKSKSSELHGIQVLIFSNKKIKLPELKIPVCKNKGMHQYLQVIDLFNKWKKISALLFL